MAVIAAPAPAPRIGNSTTAAKKLYFMASETCVGCGIENNFWQLDLATSELSVVPLQGQPGYRPGYSEDFIQGAMVCNNVYYAIYADINTARAGLATIDLATGAYKQKDISSGFPAGGQLYHALHCDTSSTATRVLAIRSDRGGANSAAFSLRQINIDGPAELVNDTKLGSFSTGDIFGGSDNVFAFHDAGADGMEVWASFPSGPDDKVKTGSLEILAVQPNADGRTYGQATSKLSATFKGSRGHRNPGYPFFLLPDNGSGDAHVAVNWGKFPNDFDCGVLTECPQWNKIDVDRKGDAVSLTPVNGVASPKENLFTFSSNYCGGMLWTIPNEHRDQIVSVDPVTLKPMQTFNISASEDQHNAGCVVCV